MWTYELYAANDTGDALKDQARESFGFQGKDAYFLLEDGTVKIVQWEGQAAAHYMGATLAKTAANHCAALNAAQACNDSVPTQTEAAKCAPF